MLIMRINATSYAAATEVKNVANREFIISRFSIRLFINKT